MQAGRRGEGRGGPGTGPLRSAQWYSFAGMRTSHKRMSLTKISYDRSSYPGGGRCVSSPQGTLVDAINRGDFVAPVRDGSGFKPNYKAIYTTLLEVALGLRHLANMAVTHCDVKPGGTYCGVGPGQTMLMTLAPFAEDGGVTGWFGH